MPVQFTTDLPDSSGLVLDASVQSEITSTWDDTINNGEYRVEWKEEEPDTETSYSSTNSATVGQASTAYTIAGLLDGEKYSIRLRTQTDHKTGSWLEAADVTKLTAAGQPTIASNTDTSVSFDWVINSDFEGSQQVYRRRIDYSYGDEGRLIDTLSTTANSYTDNTAQPDREYKYVVRAQTQWLYADSPASTPVTTTDSLGLEERAVPPRGWYVEIDHPSGTTLTPQILDDPVRRPTVNGFPRVELPVPQDETWHATAFDDAPLSVWHDGDREPVDQLEHRRLQPDRTVLEGRGGTQLDQRVIENIDVQPTHEFVRDLLEQHTDYVVNVDDPDASQEERVLQTADTDVDLQQALEPVPEDAALEITSDGAVPPHQTCWVAEGEDIAAQTHPDSSDSWSGGSAGLAADDVDELTLTISPDYTVPDGALSVAVRAEETTSNTDTTFAKIISPWNDPTDGGTSNDITFPSNLGWNQTVVETNGSAIEPGTYDIKIDVTTTGSDADVKAADVVAVFDNRFNYTFDNSVHEPAGYLDGPELYPDVVRQELEVITTPLSITEVTFDVESDDGNGLAELGIGVDGTDNYDTVTDALTHTLEYTELATTARARIGVGRDPDVTRDTQTPRTGFEPRGLDSLELGAVLDDTPVITDRSLKGKLIDVLREVLDYGNFVSEVRQDGDQTTVEVTQLEGRPADVDPDIADYSIDRQTEDVLERAIVYGGAARVTRQTVDVTVGEWVDLPFPDSRLVEGKTSVYDGDTEFTLGTDYELRRETEDGQPRIKALADGALSDGQTVSVDADVKPRGVYTAGDASDPERNVEDYDIPGLASKQMCDQVALYLVEETGDAIVDAEVTVPHDSVEWSVIEAIDPAQLPGDGPYQVREIEANASQTTLQLGQGQTIGEAVQEIRDRTSRNAERV